MTRPRATFAELLAELEGVFPPSVYRLAPPATQAQIALLEDWLGMAVPSEAREIYALHNDHVDLTAIGSIFDRTLLSVSQALEELVVHDDIRRSGIFNGEILEDERISENFPSAFHVPILSDVTGNFIGYDVRPSARGGFGQVLMFGADGHTRVVFDSIGELWSALIDELRGGNWTLGEDEVIGLTEVRFRSLNEPLRTLWA